MPTPAEVAAYIGAAAWAPQIASWAYRRFVVPQVRIMPEREVQLGYTTLGPIFNVRLSMSSDRRDAVIENMEALLTHSDGSSHALSWVGLNETFSEITDTAGNRQRVERDQPAIALKLSTVILTEKFVRFQDQAYHERHRPALARLLAQYNFLRAGNVASYRADILAGREFHDLLEFYRTEFWWKPGLYTVRFSIQSPNRSKLTPGDFAFELATFNVDAMRNNVDMMRTNYTNVVMSGDPSFEALPVTWNWQTVPFTPVRRWSQRKRQRYRADPPPQL